VNEHVKITDAAIWAMIVNYCGYEAGVRNLKKCLDRVFWKIVAKLEEKHNIEIEKAWKEAIIKILEAWDIKDVTAD
jgi:ATP-dependent Lon protease